MQGRYECPRCGRVSVRCLMTARMDEGMSGRVVDRMSHVCMHTRECGYSDVVEIARNVHDPHVCNICGATKRRMISLPVLRASR